MSPRYVLHDYRRWRVAPVSTELDGEPAYFLTRLGAGTGIVARVSECIPDDRPRRRRFKDAGYVLEIGERGDATIRERGRRKRYVTSLKAIFQMTVKAEIAMKKSLKAAAKRRRR